jgi:3-hydroxyacyl-[acyl-carrier-protein] dehydratase
MSPDSNTQRSDIDIRGIMQRIPHRFPMLLIDKVIDIVPGERATGVKNVTINEPFFQGHFPSHPIMPGVLIIEAMAQTSAVLVVDTLNDLEEGRHLVYFMTIDEARFRKPVFPGDVLFIKVSKNRQRGNVWKFKGEAYVGDDKVAEAMYSAMLVDTKRDPVPGEA